MARKMTEIASKESKIVKAKQEQAEVYARLTVLEQYKTTVEMSLVKSFGLLNYTKREIGYARAQAEEILTKDGRETEIDRPTLNININKAFTSLNHTKAEMNEVKKDAMTKLRKVDKKEGCYSLKQMQDDLAVLLAKTNQRKLDRVLAEIQNYDASFKIKQDVAVLATEFNQRRINRVLSHIKRDDYLDEI